MSTPVVRKNIIYPELSYSIVGCAYDVFNELGPGHSEKTYQNALKVAFQEKVISFKEQVYYIVKFKEHTVGKSFFDFLIDEKIIIELKKNIHYSKTNISESK